MKHKFVLSFEFILFVAMLLIRHSNLARDCMFLKYVLGLVWNVHANLFCVNFMISFFMQFKVVLSYT